MSILKFAARWGQRALPVMLLAFCCGLVPPHSPSSPYFAPLFVRPGGASCSTLRDQNVGVNPNPIDMNNTVYAATKFTAGASYTMCSVKLSVAKVGSPTMDVDVRIYSDSAGSPNAEIGTRSGAIAASTFGASEGEVTFTGMNVSINNGTTYWVVAFQSGAGDAMNHWQWFYDDAFVSSGTMGWDGMAWGTIVSRICRFKAYSQ